MAVDLAQWARWREAAQKALKYPAVVLSGKQAQLVGKGFANSVRKSRYTIWACSILPEHIHVVIARHTYEVEKIANLLKGEATKQLKKESLHPHAALVKPDERLPPMWAEHQWKVYLDHEEAIEAAIQYVDDNPIKEGKRRQNWSFVTPFRGIDEGAWVTYQ
jgi:REP element-mobilizing transposase RayT